MMIRDTGAQRGRIYTLHNIYNYRSEPISPAWRERTVKVALPCYDRDGVAGIVIDGVT